VNPIGLRSVYEEAKRFSEAVTMAYHREKNADTRIIRIFSCFGPRMDLYDQRMVTSFVRQALANEALTVNGDGTQTRSIIYIDDLLRAMVLTMEEADFHEPINLGNPEEVAVVQVAREIIELVPGTQSKIVFQPSLDYDPRVRKPDITRAKQLLGWLPKVPRKDGLAQVVKYFQQLGPTSL
jgi:dTDP-glucose 4,6-dehydratase